MVDRFRRAISVNASMSRIQPKSDPNVLNRFIFVPNGNGDVDLLRLRIVMTLQYGGDLRTATTGGLIIL